MTSSMYDQATLKIYTSKSAMAVFVEFGQQLAH